MSGRFRASDAVLFVLASPILVVRSALRLKRRLSFLAVATKSEIRCACGEALSLVGIWRCSCRFTYRGHLLRICPVCGTLPSVVRCYRCGITTKLPEP